MVTISQYASNSLNAGPKAKLDVENILKSEFKSKVHTLKLNGKEDNGKIINRIIYLLKKMFFSLRYLHGKDLTIIQFPFLNNLFFTKKLKHKIAFIHDLDGIRKQDKRIEEREIKFLNTCEGIIAHNNTMKDYLVEKGINKQKIYVLGLFDYICRTEENNDKELYSKTIEIVYTGNLDKAPFLKQIKSEKMNFEMNVYGELNGKFENKKIKYKGKYSPDELPGKIEGNLGLVWDGNFDESDENEGFKNYTKYNNPHKFSCYIAAGLPVIVWKKMAISEFVTKENIGYTINSIYDINEIDFKDYEIKKKNVKEISKKVQNGIYTQNVIKEVLKI